MLSHCTPGTPPPNLSPTVSLAGLIDLLQALADEGELDRLPPLARLFAAELADLLGEHLKAAP